MMPGMDGFDVCRQLKANPRTAHFPVLLLTTLSGSSARALGLAVGAADFLTKPISDTILFDRIRSLTSR
jgi:two-component system cell cycle response regulator